MLRMRDISNWQGTPNIDAIHDAHIIASKATEGTGYLSPAFQRDWIGTKEAGKARMAYHYFHPSVQVAAQVRFFLDNVKTAGLLNGDMLAVDLEEADGMQPAEVSAAAAMFVDMVNSETKGHCTVYTFFNFAEIGNCAGLGKHPLWIADPSRPAGQPRIPHPWKAWDFHQYGIIRGEDADIANFGNLDAMLPLGVLVSSPEPKADERILRVSDGETEVEHIIGLDKLVTGFEMKSGKAVFQIR